MQSNKYLARLGIVYCLFCVLFGCIVVRLFIVQIVYQEFFKGVIDQQYTVKKIEQTNRAPIFDRHGELLAFNVPVSSAFILPFECVKNQVTMAFLQEQFPVVYQKIMTKQGRKFLWLARHLSPEKEFFLKSCGNKDIHFVQEIARFYPHISCAHLIGMTNIDNQGVSGIELFFDQQLCGVPCQCLLSKDARSGMFYFEKKLEKLGIEGQAVSLSIDSTLQYLTYEQLKKTIDEHKASKGAALIINPDTGEILALANYPSFDPYNVQEKDIANTQNIAVTEAYELGSVIKIFSAMAALAEGVVTLDEEIHCGWKTAYFGKFKIENWKPLGVLPFSEVIRQSSNIGIAKIMKRLGTPLYDHLCKVGFGQKTGIEFPGERMGFINPPQHWSKYSIFSLSFGYEIMGTLIQLARAFSVIANGGYLIQPTLIKQEAKPKQDDPLYSADIIAQVKSILTDPQTLFAPVKKQYPLPGYTVMGKTGTARCLVNGVYSTEKHIYSFAGIVEKGDYRRVIVSFIKEPEQTDLWASQIAAPLFLRIAERMVIHDVTNT